MTKLPDDPVLFRVLNEIGIIEQLARSAFERVMPHGLKVSQFSVLNHLVRLGDGKRPADLADAFQVTRGAMTNTLGRLEGLGFVDVRPDPKDGRAKIVFLTDSGRAARFESIFALTPALDELEREIGADRFAAALPFLADLRRTLDAKR
ncbi:MAG: MarR family transcriptional regulator [Alphaproteobacteria bacterium]|nr:MarR family transcriptional regulator [Alphaproteobacteria bacterium]